ncbi:MAG: N-6 DNA methylase [Candidatus Gracilibacteria bacterium]|nr:N-6 DNA methylase [Candidatus Gracilibacteria bacterium]
MPLNQFKNLLSALGFSPKDGEISVYSKEYKNHKNYEISISLGEDLKSSKINWGKKITVVRSTSSDFSKPETLVVLECINRLLCNGYKPESIILEKDWKLGHQGKGFLDIQVLDNTGKSFLMVECKTWGTEYDKEKKNTESDGGQLFSYYVQEKNTKYLALYSSLLNGNQIQYQTDIVVINDGIKKAENRKEAFEAWHPQIFESKGIFNGDTPYEIEFEGILKQDLKELTAKDGGDIFNRFAEILRKNVVSDKTNAFNKIFNLFLCKIVDEYETGESEELKFQWKEDESNENVMIRLNDLYKRGMELYLNLKIESVSEQELQNELNKAGVNKEEIRQLFIRQKLYSGNEFAFKEVFDKKTFDENCIVVKEVVKLLEKYKIKYSTKQQFLGDFFENLLNTGIKQESGQFFTPIPIAQFICKSLPIKEIIENKNTNKEPFFLPYVIDYSSGSGHFLTEIMEEIDDLVQEIDTQWINCGEKHKDLFISQKGKYRWAEEYVYGIEKDYRLAKTTKISTFLNGDGDANIICGDGLGHFTKTKEYRGKLKEITNENENKQFDIIVANPPYSVDGFKTTLPHGKESFELFKYLTDNSSEIECLFIERTKQLLKDKAVAGIILPISILTNEGIQTKAREILLKYFNIKAIVELGSNTFMATSQNTSTLFLERKNNNDWVETKKTVSDFFKSFNDLTCHSIPKAFSTYVDEILSGTTFKNYCDFFQNKSKLIIEQSEVFQEYKELYDNLNHDDFIKTVQEIEQEKLLYFFITYKKSLILVRAPEDKIEEKDFLGYQFSKAKGREGIKVYRDRYNNNELTTKLFNEHHKKDGTKVNFYIQKSFQDKLSEIKIDNSLEKTTRIEYLHELIDLNSPNFQKKILTQKRVKISSKFPTEKLIKLYPIVDSGGTAPQDREFFKKGKYPFIRAGNISKKDEKNYVIPDHNSMLNDLAIEECNLKKFKTGTILFAKSGRSSMTNNIAMLREDAFVVNHLACIYSENQLDIAFLYYLLEYFETSNFIPIGSDYPSIKLSDIKKFPIPLVDEPLKKKIVEEMKKIDKENSRNKKEKKNEYMSQYFTKIE